MDMKWGKVRRYSTELYELTGHPGYEPWLKD